MSEEHAAMRSSANTSGLLSIARFHLAFAGLLFLVFSLGCRSQQNEVPVSGDRPAWVQEMEQQLQSRPEASVDQDTARMSHDPTFPSRESEENPPARSIFRQGEARNAQPAREPADGAPPQIEWGETRVTIEVED